MNKGLRRSTNSIVVSIAIKAVKDAAGSLSEYAKNVKPGTSMKKIKEMAWEEAVREKTRKKSS
ncbi:MAG: hypothetical protein AAB014_03075 [Nitrospirota bacterium]